MKLNKSFCVQKHIEILNRLVNFKLPMHQIIFTGNWSPGNAKLC